MITNEEYVENHMGAVCPFCLSDEELSGQSVDITAGGAMQEMSCGKCGGSWNDIYKLISFEVVEEPKDKAERHLLVVLSTAHLTKDGITAMEGLAGETRNAGPGMYADAFTYGWWLTLTPLEEQDPDEQYITEELRAIREYADKMGATVIRLDAAGPIVPELPHFNH